MKQGFLQKIIIFLALYIVISYAITFFMGGEKNDQTIAEDVTVTLDKEIGQGSTVSVSIANNTNQKVAINNDCPAEPFDVWAYRDGAWTPKTASPKIDCPEMKDFEIEAKSYIDIPYTYWSNALFYEQGRYKISVKTNVGGEIKTFESNEFEIVRPSFIIVGWDELLYRPILNGLIFLVTLMPSFSLGLAIILLTIIIRTILLIPSQKAMRSQKKMQEIQPKLEEIRKKHKGNKERIAQETMQIWKSQKVNPFGSCLPLLIQFPILIALFYVIQSGLNPDQGSLLYGSLKSFDFQLIQTNFLGILELTKINAYVLPLIIGLLQFVQMKMAISSRKKTEKVKDGEKPEKSEMEIANNMMVYFLPVMIAMFTASVPAGVGLYWGVSTLYGIAQQYVVNRESTATAQVKVLN